MADHSDFLIAAALLLGAAALVCALLRQCGDEIRQLRRALETEGARSQMLLNVVLDMRVSGGVVDRLARSRDVDAKVPKAKRSDIEQAIDENKYASSNVRLRKHLGEWARRELEKDDSARARQAVLDRLRTWSAVSADDDDDDDEDGVVAL